MHGLILITHDYKMKIEQVHCHQEGVYHSQETQGPRMEYIKHRIIK